MDIGDPGQCGDPITGGPCEQEGITEQRDCANGQRDRTDDRGEDPPKAPGVELRKSHPLPRLKPTEEESGDQIAGEGEEEVGPDRPTREREPRMCGKHQQDGDAAETLELRSKV